MNDTHDKAPVADELGRINSELASLVRTTPAELALGADLALKDDLVICGILGGKNVGKSTLINALAKTEVSVDPREVGKGTQRPMAYAHQEMRSAVADRLEHIRRYAPLDITLHRADAVRNAVLLDLPDFDSEFEDHLRVVRAVAPLLDRVIWVLTPRKMGDRAWVAIFRDVIKDPQNARCVLNKVDELLSDSDLAGGGERTDGNGRRGDVFWTRQHEWMARTLAESGCEIIDSHRFLVAAAFPDPERFAARIAERWDDPDWARYSADRPTVNCIARLASDELDRLRAGVLCPISKEQVSTIKKANSRREGRVNAARIREHYDLDHVLDQLTEVCDAGYHQEVLNEAMGPDYCAAVASAVETQLRRDPELADEFLERRVEQWPLLRLVHWPFGWLSRVAGRRISPVSLRANPRAKDPFDVGGRKLDDRIELIRTRILADNSFLADQLNIECELPAADALASGVAAAVRDVAPTFEAQILDELDRRTRRPSILGKAALWFILLWFPLLQPVLAGGLEMYVETGGWNLAHGLYRIVSALSAAHLLGGLTIAMVIYVGLLAGMYARGLRHIKKLRDEYAGPTQLSEAIDEILVSEVLLPLAGPFQHRLNRLTVLKNRLGAQ